MLRCFLAGQGYYNIRKLDDGRFICLYQFLFTTGLIVDADYLGYNHRYCYPDKDEAIAAIETWNGKGEPSGNWVAKK